MSNINLVLDEIYRKSPLQKKKIESFINSKDVNYKQEFEKFLSEYIDYLNNNSMTIEYCIDSYLDMVSDMFKSQIKFMRTGEYPILDTTRAVNDVYNNETKMLSYMVGLALSQYLWNTHYEMFKHFSSSILENKDRIAKYLEIGPGHGIFLKKAINILDDDIKITAIDISKTSLKVSRSIINYFYPLKDINYINADMLNLDINSKYDFIVMGEVLEHVEDPKSLLIKISKLLNKNGRAFVSTCINCPMIDHVYHFHNVGEIREMFKICGLAIETEKVLPVEDMSMNEIVKNRVTINYSAIVRKA